MQAYVWDLGFQDMPVDKIVDASVQTIASRERDANASATQAEDLMRVTMEALSSRPPGSSMGPRYITIASLHPVGRLPVRCFRTPFWFRICDVLETSATPADVPSDIAHCL